MVLKQIQYLVEIHFFTTKKAQSKWGFLLQTTLQVFLYIILSNTSLSDFNYEFNAAVTLQHTTFTLILDKEGSSREITLNHTISKDIVQGSKDTISAWKTHLAHIPMACKVQWVLSNFNTYLECQKK